MRTMIAAVAGALALATAVPADADGNAANLDQLIEKIYNDVQSRCTPSMPPNFQRIAWDTFPVSFGPYTDTGHYPTGQGGTGRIIDATRTWAARSRCGGTSAPTRRSDFVRCHSSSS